ncbi:MAG: hypothetical protein HQL46_10360 [Gammaproteobacteria bacterium]|nr:hypothetical protein [Gammaproteobacteria bacterium]
MKIPFKIITVTLVSGTLMGCFFDNDDSDSKEDVSNSFNETVQKDTASMDKNYVPSLFYSNMTVNQSLASDASTTLSRTSNSWDSFKNNYNGYFDWNNYFSEVDTNIATAESHYAGLTTYPADLTIAHEALEEVRDTWSTMRTSNDISYFFDSVTAAHHSMEPVSGAAKTYTTITAPDADDLSALQNALSNSLTTFQSDWSSLKSAYDDGSNVKSIYNLSSSKATALSLNINNASADAPGMTQILSALDSAVNSCVSTSYDFDNPLDTDPCYKMINLSSKVKGKFVKIFLSLGDFLNPFMSDLIALNKTIIPALYCTGNPPNASQVCVDELGDSKQGTLNYLNALVSAKLTFESHFPVSTSMNVPGVLGWSSSLLTVESSVQEAISTLTGATDLATAKTNGAHEAIESVRSAMHSIVADWENQTTLMTRTNDYHSTFENILAIALDSSGTVKSSLSANEVSEINSYMPKLQSTFDEMKKQADQDDTSWGIVDGALSDSLTALENNISALVDALSLYDETSNDNSSEVASLSESLKKKFIPYFIQLGAF